MKERPILMSAPMVRATLRAIDPKTQTRRVVKGEIGERDGLPTLNGQPLTGCPAVLAQCPYGVPGDRLWVRETFSPSPDGPIYRATEAEHGITECDDVQHWKPSIFMPRALSRITLEITDVRVQRLQEISSEDADAEGVKGLLAPGFQYEHGPRSDFCTLWNRINGKRPGCAWSDNPWVWAVSFTRITPP